MTTAYFRPIFFTDWATRSGSSGSLWVGLPVVTLQKPQRRVHVSPRIMKVAVPRCQQSPMLGQAASAQTVFSPSSSIMRDSSRYLGEPGALTLNQDGLAGLERQDLAEPELAGAAGVGARAGLVLSLDGGAHGP